MATNIVKEDNLLKVKHHTTTLVYDETRKDDLLSKTDLDLIVVFKDKDGEYPTGKIVVSNEFVTKYNYKYVTDDIGNVLSCTITKTVSKNGQSTDIEKTSTTSFYDANGRVVKKEYYTRDGIMYNREQFWYWETGKLKTKKVKSTHVIETTEYNHDGNIVLVWAKTIASKCISRKYSATYNEKGEIVHYVEHSKGYECFIERDLDHEGNLLSITEIFKHLSDRKIFAKTTKVYDPNAGYKLSRVIKNGFVVDQYWYDLEGQVIKNVKSEKDNDIITTIIERSTDTETGEKTVEKHIYFVNKCGKQHSKYIKEVYDENNNLLTFAEDNSKVTTYTYNEDGKRESAITKQIIDEEFVVIDKITYTYSTEETGEEKKTRVEERYDAKGNITYKQTHTESITDTKKEYTVENRVYEVPEADDSTNP
jgi:hypothetical protein